MIVKERKVPLSILKLRALTHRIPQSHPKIPSIMNELKKREAGFKGESAIDFPLSFLEPKNYFIFHDLRLTGSIPIFSNGYLISIQKICPYYRS